MITRLDDDLHTRLKEQAAAEGRSLNEFVIETLAKAVHQPLTRKVVRERLRAAGRLWEPNEPVTRPDPERLKRASTGTGHSVSEALDADRGEW